MKKTAFLFIFLILSGLAFSDYVGKTYVTYDPQEGKNIKVLSLKGKSLTAFIENEITEGNLVLRRSDRDTVLDSVEHRRLSQQYKGIPVFGGEIIQHIKNDIPVDATGHYYKIEDSDLTAGLSVEDVVKIFQEDLGIAGEQEKAEDISYIIYPASDGSFRFCYQVKLKLDVDYYETAIIDARSGEIYVRDTNLHFSEAAIGLGKDYHGVYQKFPTLKENNIYYLYDDRKVRPYVQGTFDYRTGYSVPVDHDNYWDQDGTSISAHYHVGLVYDFYYLFLNRSGMDTKNMDTLIVTHSSLYGYSDNASWNGVSLNFYVSGKNNAQFAAAIDVVAHEFSHGVTQFSSDLVYQFQSGALNESFSDIMGIATEFYWHPVGTGLYKADWLVGEDAFPSYDYAVSKGLVRSAEDPNRFSQTGWILGPDPCHLSQYYNLSFSIDRGGVHINCTIYPHAYYLLTDGGTNRISKISVSGIGLEKATKIFYRAWVYYLTSNSQFIDAANAILKSAYDLYGGSSNEFAQTAQAMRAIGWIVN